MPESKSSDDTLAFRAAQGDLTALSDLCGRHRATHQRIALRIMGNAADAEDVVQSAQLAIATKIGTFDGRGSYAAWSNRIVRNSALMLRRYRARRPEVRGEAAHLAIQFAPANDVGDAHRAFVDREIRDAVTTLIARLEPKYRRALELSVDELSMAELSSELGLSVAGAKSRLHRARSSMRLWLETEYGLRP